MADQIVNSEARECATCGATYTLNPSYSASQRRRSRFCSRRCAGKANPPPRQPLADLLAGQTRFGMLTFVGEGAPKGLMRRGIFRCDCGVEKEMGLHHVRNGRSFSCGCEAAKRAASRFTKHGAYRTPEYRSWNAMTQRCHNENSTSYQHYGARGIKVCPEWHGPSGFHRFLAYVGPRPRGTSIDRIDNNKGYEPGNVRWATAKEQQNNRGISALITHEGVTLNVHDWSLRLGMARNTVDARIRAGWTVERSLTEPLHNCGKRSSVRPS